MSSLWPTFWTATYRLSIAALLAFIAFEVSVSGDAANSASRTAQRAADEATEAVAAVERAGRRVEQLKASIDALGVDVRELNVIVTEDAQRTDRRHE